MRNAFAALLALASAGGLHLAFSPQSIVQVVRVPPAQAATSVALCDGRTPIDVLPFVIVEPGSYVVTASLDGAAGQDGILVAADHVTIDLAGHTLSGVTGSLAGIRALPGHHDVAVHGGTVTRFDADGVILEGPGARVESVRALDNGGSGFGLGSGSALSGCIARGNGAYGIQVGFGALVESSTANENQQGGILLVPAATASGSIARGCTARANVAFGIQGGDGCVIESCSVVMTAGPGILVGPGSVVAGCALALNNGDGVAGSGALVHGNSSAGNSGADYAVSGGTLVENHP